jgi:hypothetical protein
VAADHLGAAVQVVGHLAHGFLNIVVPSTPLPRHLAPERKLLVGADEHGEEAGVCHLAGGLHRLAPHPDQLDSLTERDGAGEYGGRQLADREAGHGHTVLHHLRALPVQELHGGQARHHRGDLRGQD